MLRLNVPMVCRNVQYQRFFFPVTGLPGWGRSSNRQAEHQTWSFSEAMSSSLPWGTSRCCHGSWETLSIILLSCCSWLWGSFACSHKLSSTGFPQGKTQPKESMSFWFLPVTTPQWAEPVGQKAGVNVRRNCILNVWPLNIWAHVWFI